MQINKQILTKYISRGTILQKNIDNLKYLATQQNTLHRRMGSHHALPKTDIQEQRMIEENVNSIMKSIFRIIFNRWVLFTHHQIKYVSEPK
jgi:hypothetical protein